MKITGLRTWHEVSEDLWGPDGPPPIYCEKCGHPIGYGHDAEKPCRAGYCTVICCAGCGYEWASFGPVGCPCQSRDPKLRRIRTMYRARRR